MNQDQMNYIDKIAHASGFEKKLLADGSMGFRPYVYVFAQALAKDQAKTLRRDQTNLIRQDLCDLFGLTDDGEFDSRNMLNECINAVDIRLNELK